MEMRDVSMLGRGRDQLSNDVEKNTKIGITK